MQPFIVCWEKVVYFGFRLLHSAIHLMHAPLVGFLIPRYSRLWCLTKNMVYLLITINCLWLSACCLLPASVQWFWANIHYSLGLLWLSRVNKRRKLQYCQSSAFINPEASFCDLSSSFDRSTLQDTNLFAFHISYQYFWL